MAERIGKTSVRIRLTRMMSASALPVAPSFVHSASLSTTMVAARALPRAVVSAIRASALATAPEARARVRLASVGEAEMMLMLSTCTPYLWTCGKHVRSEGKDSRLSYELVTLFACSTALNIFSASNSGLSNARTSGNSASFVSTGIPTCTFLARLSAPR